MINSNERYLIRWYSNNNSNSKLCKNEEKQLWAPLQKNIIIIITVIIVRFLINSIMLLLCILALSFLLFPDFKVVRYKSAFNVRLNKRLIMMIVNILITVVTLWVMNVIVKWSWQCGINNSDGDNKTDLSTCESFWVYWWKTENIWPESVLVCVVSCSKVYPSTIQTVFFFFFCLVLFLLKIFCLKCKRNGRIRCCKRRSSRWYGQRDEEREMIPEVRGHGGRTTEMSNVTVEAEQTYRIPRFSKLYKRQLFSLK